MLVTEKLQPSHRRPGERLDGGRSCALTTRMKCTKNALNQSDADADAPAMNTQFMRSQGGYSVAGAVPRRARDRPGFLAGSDNLSLGSEGGIYAVADPPQLAAACIGRQGQACRSTASMTSRRLDRCRLVAGKPVRGRRGPVRPPRRPASATDARKWRPSPAMRSCRIDSGAPRAAAPRIRQSQGLARWSSIAIQTRVPTGSVP